MCTKTYSESINTALKTMDAGNYKESLTFLKEVIKSENFLKLTLKEQLFIRKRTSWVQLSLGYYERGLETSGRPNYISPPTTQKTISPNDPTTVPVQDAMLTMGFATSHAFAIRAKTITVARDWINVRNAPTPPPIGD